MDASCAPTPGTNGAVSNGDHLQEQRHASGGKLLNGKYGTEIKEPNAGEIKKSNSIEKGGVPGEWFIVSAYILTDLNIL